MVDILNIIMGFGLSYTLVFLICLLEGAPFTGIVTPGQTLVTILGFASSLGYFDILGVIALGSIGAILGDSISYYCGRKYGRGLLKRFEKSRFFKAHHLKKAEKFSERHPAYALIFGRLNPVTRAFVPALLGAEKEDKKKFAVCIIISGILCVSFYAILGSLFGESFAFAKGYFG